MKRLLLPILLSVVALFSSCEKSTTTQEIPEVKLVERVTISHASVDIEVDDIFALNALVEPQEADVTRVVWTIENATTPGFITVNNAGLVTAIEPGSGEVVATSIDGSACQDRCRITVLAPPMKYQVGDPYPNAEEAIGIVFYTEGIGHSGKVVSLVEGTDLGWGPNSAATGADDPTSGLFNMARIGLIDPTYSKYPAFSWIHSAQNGDSADYGDGALDTWYLPSHTELRQLYAAMCGFRMVDSNPSTGQVLDWGTNSVLSGYAGFAAARAEFSSKIIELGGTAIGDTWYWSSSELVNYYSWKVDLFTGLTFENNKEDQFRVRPILAFDTNI